MERIGRLIGAALASALALAGCDAGQEVALGRPATPTPTPPPSSVSPAPVSKNAPVAATVAGLNDFATRFYAAAATPGQNFVFSPLSIGYAFAMLRAGAKGGTAAQLDKVFGFPADVAAAF